MSNGENLGKWLGSHGVAETVLGLFGVPKEHPIASDRVAAIATAAVGLFAAYMGQDPGTFTDQVVGAFQSFWSGAHELWSDASILLGIFGIGRSPTSARKF